MQLSATEFGSLFSLQIWVKQLAIALHVPASICLQTL